MENLFEKTMRLETAEAFDEILKTQTRTYGALEIDRLPQTIRENNIKSVLDIGTGEGSFLFDLAAKNRDIQSVGLDHNDDFLKRAVALNKQMRLQNIKLESRF